MQTYTIHPLAVGVNQTDQGVMTYLKGYGRRIFLPVYCFCIKGGDRNILVDTGLEQVVVPDEVRAACPFEVLGFEEALSRVGLAPEAVDVVIHTHLHNDHCENDGLCANASIYVQRSELDFMADPHPIDHRYDADLLDGMTIVPLDGDADLFDGISVVLTPGHTVGGQSVVVRTAEGNAVITGFCCNEHNFPEVGPAVAPGVHIDVREAWDSAQRVRAAADILIPIHAMWVGEAGVIP